MKNLTKISLVILSSVLFLSFSISIGAQNKQDIDKALEPFPKAQEGMVRHVIELKKKSDESLYQVEIIPGKVMSVDCNVHMLMGELFEKDLEGWGYNYYEFKSDGATASTMMGCNKPNENKFVSGQTLMVRYNSKLPIVIYAPKGFEVKYRIWKAEKEKNSLEK